MLGLCSLAKHCRENFFFDLWLWPKLSVLSPLFDRFSRSVNVLALSAVRLQRRQMSFGLGIAKKFPTVSKSGRKYLLTSIDRGQVVGEAENGTKPNHNDQLHFMFPRGKWKSHHERFPPLIVRHRPRHRPIKTFLIMLIILFIASRDLHRSTKPTITMYPERATHTVIIHANPTLIVKLLMEK